MKTKIIAAAAIVATVALAIQPTAAQRRGPAMAESVRGQALLNVLSEDLEAVATELEFTQEQRGRVEGLVNDFNAQHADALARLGVIRDSLRNLRPLRGDRAEARELVVEFRDVQRDLRPAFEEFEGSVGDILTWNQGREVADRYGPRQRIGRFAQRGRGWIGQRFERGPRRFSIPPRRGWGRR